MSLHRLDGSGFEHRLGQNFLLSTLVKTGPGVHLSSCAMGNRAFSRRQSVLDLALTNPPPVQCQGQSMCKAIHPRPLCACMEYYADIKRPSINLFQNFIIELLRETLRSGGQQRKNTIIETTHSYYSGSKFVRRYFLVQIWTEVTFKLHFTSSSAIYFMPLRL